MKSIEIFKTLAILGIACLSSCSKEIINDGIEDHIIDGHLYRDCFSEPLKGVYLEIREMVPNGLNHKRLYDTAVTDSNGYFRFEYKTPRGYGLYIKHSKGEGGHVVHDFIPYDTNIRNMDLYFHPTVNVEVYLNVINPYSEMDTLFVNDFKEGYRKPGPFKSGFLFRTEDVYLFDMSFKNDYYVSYQLFPYRGSPEYKNFRVTEYCDNTVKVTLDIE